MTFEKGNKYGKGGARPHSGPKKEPKRLIKEALEKLDTRLPELIDVIYLSALKGDQKAAQYLIDRRLGRPKETGEIVLDVRIATFLDIARKSHALPLPPPQLEEPAGDSYITTTATNIPDSTSYVDVDNIEDESRFDPDHIDG